MVKPIFQIFTLLILLNSYAISNQVYFTLINEIPLDNEPVDIVINEGLAYIITGAVLYSFNTDNPYSGDLKNYQNMSGTTSISFSGRFAFTIGSGSGISVYDLTKDPPVRKNSIITSGKLTKLVIDNGYMYVINQSAGLQVYDVNIPDFPVFKNTQLLNSDANGIFVRDKKAYVTSKNANLSIIDVSDVSAMPIIGTYTNGVNFYEPYIDGDYAYLPQGNTGVQVLNITKLPFPEWITNLYARKFARQVVSSNFYVWVADDKSIEGFFQKNSKTYYFAGNFKNNDVINRIAVIDGKYIFMCTADKKLKILKIDYSY